VGKRCKIAGMRYSTPTSRRRLTVTMSVILLLRNQNLPPPISDLIASIADDQSGNTIAIDALPAANTI